MRKLISADLYRLLRNKIFWIELVAVLGVAIWIVFANYAPEYQASENRLYLDDVFFNFFQLLGIFLATGVSLIVGAEYGDGAIRNKLVVGHTRLQIYGAQLVSTLVSTALVLTVYGISTGVFGYILFRETKISLTQFWVLAACSCLLALAQTALYTALSMNIVSKAIAPAVTILLSCAMLLFANSLYSQLQEPERTYEDITITMDGVEFGEEIDNPAYVEGTLRTVMEGILDVLPEGQIIQIQAEETEHVAYWPVLSVVYFTFVTGVGYGCFRKKDVN